MCDIVGEGLCALPKTILTDIGKEVEKALSFINGKYSSKIIKYVIMPNHIHFIIKMAGWHGDQSGGRGDPPLQDVIGRMKSYTTKQHEKPLWQRSFYDHIIRDEADYIRICEYIGNNPSKWTEDKYYII